MGKRKPQLSDYSDDDIKVTKKKSSKKNHEKKLKEFDLEEGEVSDSESSDNSDEEFNDGYHSDMMGDEEDRFRLAQMTEKEREQEIFRRVEARETMKTRFNIERKLRREKRRELKKQRLLESASDSVDGFSDRKKPDENSSRSGKKSSSKMRHEDAHEFDREKLKEEQYSKRDSGSKSSRSSKTKLKASDIYSDSDSSEEQIVRMSRFKKKPVPSSSSSSDSEPDMRARVRGTKRKIQYVSTSAQLNQMKLSRYRLERFVKLPFFKRLALGCFVKVTIAADKGRSVYRICEIIDVTETEESYQLGDIQTNKVFMLKHGTLERNFRLEFVSNSNFLDGDFVKWRDTCTLHGVKMPTVEQMELKMKDIKEALLFELTMEEVERIINEKERFKNSPYEFAMKRTQLEKECEASRAAGDSMRAGELQDELNELEERAVKLDQFRTSTISSIKYINDRNRRRSVREEEKDSKEQKVKSSPTSKVKKPIAEQEELFESSDINDSTIDSSAFSDGSDGETDSPVVKMNPQKEGKNLRANIFFILHSSVQFNHR